MAEREGHREGPAPPCQDCRVPKGGCEISRLHGEPHFRRQVEGGAREWPARRNRTEGMRKSQGIDSFHRLAEFLMKKGLAWATGTMGRWEVRAGRGRQGPFTLCPDPLAGPGTACRTCTMLLMTIGRMLSGKRRMLNKAKDTKALWASRMLFLSIVT